MLYVLIIATTSNMNLIVYIRISYHRLLMGIGKLLRGNNYNPRSLENLIQNRPKSETEIDKKSNEVKKEIGTMSAMLEFNTRLAQYQLALAQADAARMQLVQEQAERIAEQMASPESENSLEKMILPVIMQRLIQPTAPQTNDPFMMTMPTAEGVPSPSDAVAIPKESDADRVNGILRKIAIIPDKFITRDAVEGIAASNGIDVKALKSFAKKVNRVL